MIGFLKDLVELESPSKDPDAQQPILSMLCSEFEKLNFHAQAQPGRETGGFLFARPSSRDKDKKLQLLIGHCDTVWDKKTLLKMPITKANGTLTGPGVYDMKAGLTQMIFALRGIEYLNLNMPLCPVVLINSDEEIGSIESGKTIKRLARISDRAYVMEPPLGLDGKLKTARKGNREIYPDSGRQGSSCGPGPYKGSQCYCGIISSCSKALCHERL